MVRTIPLGVDKQMVIRQSRNGTNTIPLPASNDTVEIIAFMANAVAYVNAKSGYSGKFRNCKNANELATALTKPKQSVGKSSHKNLSTSPKRKSSSEKRSDNDLKIMNSDDFKEYGNVKAKNGIAIDEETGEVAWEYRKLKSLKRVWRKQSYYLFNSAYWEKSVGVTLHLDTSPTFEAMSKLVEDFFRHIKRKYKGDFKCGFIFLEPCFDGSWHAHLIINFYDAFPEKFESDTEKWWNKFNAVPSSEQVEFSYYNDFENFENYVNYLNPANVDKKRNRVRYYPKSSQPMRHCGDAEYPNIALATYGIAQEIVGSDKPTKRTKTEIVDTATNEVLYYHATYHYYKPNIKFSTAYHSRKSKPKGEIEALQNRNGFRSLNISVCLFRLPMAYPKA